MDEDFIAISESTRNEKVKNFFINNKKFLISILLTIILLVVGYFVYDEYKDNKKKKIADQFNLSSIEFILGKNENIESEMIEIIESKNKTYSPLALYFLLDNNIIDSKEKINRLFDIIINDTNLDKEIKNLNIYKKALYNSDSGSENNLLKILKPLINSESIWKSHALYLIAEFFYSKNEKQKSKEFFEKILKLENGNPSIKKEAQKRIQRDFSE